MNLVSFGFFYDKLCKAKQPPHHHYVFTSYHSWC
jgi:hypothetical protein